jgi:peptidyl-tRNA hydrolase, PTH2 family
MNCKQVIVMRTDLRNTNGNKIRTGKLISQGAHASMKAILDLMSQVNDWKFISTDGKEGFQTRYLKIDATTPLNYWLNGLFTKICLSVDSEQELLDIYNKAKDNGLICSLITDSGLTEFNGVPTITCCAIGPSFSEDIDKITGHLKLL